MAFVHLHVHTQYSILDGLSSIETLFNRAEEMSMPALAITDHGNMYGVKEFLKFAGKHKDADGNYKVKPIIGCEVYVTRHYDHHEKRQGYYHLILLAKNYDGYKNLVKIVSEGHTDGLYYGKPRVSHEVLEKYHENLICSSACIAGEIPQDILAGNLDAAKEAIKWHQKVFGDDYYLEVMLHRTEVPGLSLEVYDYQKQYNEVLFQLASELGVKVIATNDVHFVNKDDGPAHDHLICLNTGKKLADADRLHYTQQEYLKSEEEMAALFPDHPEALANTLEVADKVEAYSIDRDPVLPKFDLGEEFLSHIDAYLEKYKDVIDSGRNDKKGNYRGDEFCNSVAYLCELCYKGAEKRYGTPLDKEHADRIDFELKTICRMGYPDYFLIVQDYIGAHRREGYMVGPGRGSAAGSVVAYCLGITNIDPIKYDLLFERFLNPDRISMPDIDVDFEDINAAHRYVVEKYGEKNVSRVITFGTMLAKGAIKDVARVEDLPLADSTWLAGLVPDRLSEMKEKEYPFNPKFDTLLPGFKSFQKEVEVEDPDNPDQKKKEMKWFQRGMEETPVKITLKNCYRLVPALKDAYENGTDQIKSVLRFAEKLEGSIRQVGMHACATIIGRGDLTDYLPMCLSVDKETGKLVRTSQYDGHYIEEVGMLKMDFLGLNTLSIIHKCLDSIKQTHRETIDIEAIPIDDKETYELYGRGDTDNVFQFESPGMKQWLQRLHPERFEDLIAMNALYRPGPMDYIPDFVDRKLGLKPIEYDLPEMEEYLEDTYGVTVYQEQVMLLSQKLAGFTKGQADKLRKAMGKKQISTLEELRDKFMEGGEKNGHPDKMLDKIWKDWEKFASYAFNKSHATCYAWVSYQTGWLKCHYTAEFLAANLSCNLSNMTEIKKILADCKAHKIKVLCPDVNESDKEFTVNKDGNIRYGLAGMKGFGSNVVDAIISEREKKGPYKDLFDFVERLDGILNRKSLETLIYSGAFDSFGYSKKQYFLPCQNGEQFIDELAKYATRFSQDSMDASSSLFGDAEEFKPQRPEIPAMVGEEDVMDLLQKEKEIVGIYISAHPLDRYQFEMENFTNMELQSLQGAIAYCEAKRTTKKLMVAGLVTECSTGTTKSGKPYAKAILEDYSGNYEFRFFGKDYEAYMSYLQPHACLFLEGDIEERYRVRQDDNGQVTAAPYDFRVKKMMLLGNVAETMMSGCSLGLTTSMLTDEFRKSLTNILKANSGKIPLEMKLFDPKTKFTISFHSKKYFVTVTTDFVSELKSIGISCHPMLRH
jgi:DNA polymerase-3 subunit alpha